MTVVTLRDLVREALSNALVNGETFAGLTPEQIVADLIEKCADVEDEQPEAIRPHVEQWLLDSTTARSVLESATAAARDHVLLSSENCPKAISQISQLVYGNMVAHDMGGAAMLPDGRMIGAPRAGSMIGLLAPADGTDNTDFVFVCICPGAQIATGVRMDRETARRISAEFARALES